VKLIVFLALVLPSLAVLRVLKFERDTSQSYAGAKDEYHCFDDDVDPALVQGRVGMELAFEGEYFPENDTASVDFFVIGGEQMGKATLTYNDTSVSADTPFTWKASSGQMVTADPFTVCLWTATPQSGTVAGYWDDKDQPNYLCVNEQTKNVTGTYVFKYDTSEEFGAIVGKPFGWNQFANYYGTFYSLTGPYEGQNGPLLFKADLTLATPAMRGFSCFKSGSNYTECFEEYYALVSPGNYTTECSQGPPVATSSSSTTGGSTTGSSSSSANALALNASTPIVFLVIYALAMSLYCF